MQVTLSEPSMDAFPDAVISTDAGTGCVVRWNPASALLLGLRAEEVLGRKASSVLSLEDRDHTGLFPERQWVSCGGRRLPVEVTRWSSQHEGLVIDHLLLRESERRLEHEQQTEQHVAVLRRQARSDALTGVANRYELEERYAVAASEQNQAPLALLVIDLDGFKALNDQQGHAVGDEVLAAVAGRLLHAMRADDTVARLGGDEFVVLTRLPEGASNEALLDRVRGVVVGPVATSAGRLVVHGSVGLAVADSEDGFEDLLRRADKAMYREKVGRQ